MATLRQKLRLLRGLIHGEAAFGGPFYMDVDVTRRCNMHCVGCQYHSSRTRNSVSSDSTVRDVPLEQMKQLCTELPKLGTPDVFLVGEGEPMLHPRWADIVSAFKAAGCTVHLFTNGTLIDKTRAQALLESGLDELRVSLWANTVEEYRLCHPGVDLEYFSRTLDGVKMLTSLKARHNREYPTVILTEPINRHNYGSVRRRIGLAHDLGCDGVAFDTYRHWSGEFGSVALSPREIEEVGRELTRQREMIDSLSLSHNIDCLLAKHRLGEGAWSRVPCYAGWFFARIRVDGTVVPCGMCSLELGNIRKAGFEEVWNGPRYRAFRRQASSPGGLASLSRVCDCGWCCYAGDNLAVHRYAKWFAGLRGRRDG